MFLAFLLLLLAPLAALGSCVCIGLWRLLDKVAEERGWW